MPTHHGALLHSRQQFLSTLAILLLPDFLRNSMIKVIVLDVLPS